MINETCFGTLIPRLKLWYIDITDSNDSIFMIIPSLVLCSLRRVTAETTDLSQTYLDFSLFHIKTKQCLTLVYPDLLHYHTG